MRSLPLVASSDDGELELPEHRPKPSPGRRATSRARSSAVRRCGDGAAPGAWLSASIFSPAAVCCRESRREERRRGSPGGELRGVVAGLRRGLRLGPNWFSVVGMNEAMAAGAASRPAATSDPQPSHRVETGNRGALSREGHRSVARHRAARRERVRSRDHQRHTPVQLPRLVHADADDDDADDVLDARKERKREYQPDKIGSPRSHPPPWAGLVAA